MKLKDYNSLPNFLTRKTLVHIGRVHIRLHDILCKDRSPYLHNHPFYYISIVLNGGYSEQILRNGSIQEIKHGIGSIIYRKPNDFHRIKEINGPTKTLFLTFKVKMNWSLKKNHDLGLENFKTPSKKGVYIRKIKDKTKFYKFDEFWHVGNENFCVAFNEKRLSIHQSDEYLFK